MKELFDIADKYYDKTGITAAVKERPIVFLFFTIFIATVLVAIFLLLTKFSIFQPISWKDFFKSLGGILYLISLIGVLICYYILDRSRPSKLSEKKEILCKLFGHNELTLDFLERLNDLFVLYKKYNGIPQISVMLNLERAIRYIASIVFAAVLSSQFRAKGVVIIKEINFIAALFIVFLFITYYFIFRSLIPYWIKSIKRLIKSSEERIEWLLGDLSVVVDAINNKKINHDNKIKESVEEKFDIVEQELVVEQNKNIKMRISFKLTNKVRL